jgi:hypothetical protein
MKIKRIIKYYLFNESVKEMELNKILDKVSNRKSLTARERNFLELYKTTREEDMKDFLYISKNSTFKKVSELLEIGKKVICDLHDRNGKIGLEITGIENNFEEDTCTVSMKGDEKHQLHDKFLYNLIYSIKKDQYSLQEQDEYFEKIESKDED